MIEKLELKEAEFDLLLVLKINELIEEINAIKKLIEPTHH